MTTFPNFSGLLKAGVVLIDSACAAVLRVITLQYDADTLSRPLQVKGIGRSGGRLEGPAVQPDHGGLAL